MIRLALRHRFPAATLDIAFDAPTPATTVLFGPSGAGKTSVVAAVSGLFRPDVLRVEVDGTVLADTASGVWVPPERRRIGVVFQDARLFPHMNVASNLRYGLRRAPQTTSDRPIGFDELVDLLGIARLLPQRPHTLSGGERQRVAIGRALLSQPRLLLMDEPLAGLDAARKAEILPFLANLKTATSLPILYVTHALDELARLADTVVLIEAGEVTAAGPLADITARGSTLLSARDDAGVVLQLQLSGHDPLRRLSHLHADGFGLVTTRLEPQPSPGPLRVRIAARDVILAHAIPAEISVHNRLQGQVRAIIADQTGDTALVEVEVGTVVILARITQDAVSTMQLTPGRPVVALVKSSSVEVLG